METDSLPAEVSSLLIPMQGRPWLLPNSAVAEVVDIRQPDRPGRGADWMLGWISWRDQDVPFISYERLNQSGQVKVSMEARIVIVNTIEEDFPFFAIIAQGIPQKVNVREADLLEEPTDTGPAEAALVQLGDAQAVIPDLDAIDQALSTLQRL